MASRMCLASWGVPPGPPERLAQERRKDWEPEGGHRSLKTKWTEGPLCEPRGREAVFSGTASSTQMLSAFSRCHHPAAAAPEAPPQCQPTLALLLPGLFPSWGCPFTSSSQAPFLRIYEPSDLGWAGLGPAGIYFGLGVGYPEKIYASGRVAKKQ